ncbi:MAG: hypothetical protein JF564_05360 [Sphingomonas sp.]|nr:hypothetical protein [Sphingomonas sp.]
MPSTLKTFTITPSEGQYLLTLEEDDGSESEFLMTYDQLDLIAEEIDRQLDSDEEKELEVSDEAGEE